jgi:hypothetical protein
MGCCVIKVCRESNCYTTVVIKNSLTDVCKAVFNYFCVALNLYRVYNLKCSPKIIKY